MAPRTEIIYNYEYARRLYRGNEKFEDVWRRVIGLGADFEAIHAEYGEHILELIERYSGFSWLEGMGEFIPIYIVDSPPSFFQPLTLTVDEDPIVMLRDCIGQFAHQNMNIGFLDDDLYHRCLELITNQIMCDLRLEKRESDGWDVRKKTVREYLKK